MYSLFAWEPGGSISSRLMLPGHSIHTANSEKCPRLHQSSAIAELQAGFYTICQHRDLQGFKLFSPKLTATSLDVWLLLILAVLQFPLGEQPLHLAPSASAVVGQE
jgi:hypothetical protein